MIYINQYLHQKEEEVFIKLRILTGDNFNEYRRELQRIKDENIYELILPFIEFIVDLISSGTNIAPDKLDDWWVLYLNTMQYKGESLKYATSALCYELSDSLRETFRTNIFARFIKWIKNKLNHGFIL